MKFDKAPITIPQEYSEFADSFFPELITEFLE